MNYTELSREIKRRRTYLCVGLDTDPAKLPGCLAGTDAERMLSFNRAMVDATAPHCVAYKPNVAFYEGLGSAGWGVLEATVRYIRATQPGHFIIADAKRGDIGNTSERYARAFFEALGVDALTVAPYMGADSVTPFLGAEGKWVVLLALTSNRGSSDFQTLGLSSSGQAGECEALWQRVLRTSRAWADHTRMMYVVGATHPDMFAAVRRLVPDHFLLVPGVGAQGGSLAAVSRAGLNDHCGLLVNSSRGIIYASSGDDYAAAAGRAAEELHRQMDGLLRERGL